ASGDWGSRGVYLSTHFLFFVFLFMLMLLFPLFFKWKEVPPTPAYEAMKVSRTQIQPKTCRIISAMNGALVSDLAFPVWTWGFSSMIGFNLFLRQPFYLSADFPCPTHS